MLRFGSRGAGFWHQVPCFAFRVQQYLVYFTRKTLFYFGHSYLKSLVTRKEQMLSTFKIFWSLYSRSCHKDLNATFSNAFIHTQVRLIILSIMCSLFCVCYLSPLTPFLCRRHFVFQVVGCKIHLDKFWILYVFDTLVSLQLKNHQINM